VALASSFKLDLPKCVLLRRSPFNPDVQGVVGILQKTSTTFISSPSRDSYSLGRSEIGKRQAQALSGQGIQGGDREVAKDSGCGGSTGVVLGRMSIKTVRAARSEQMRTRQC
jgi:hypothetical protein